MANITFYPLGNADSCLIKTDNGHRIVFDYADKKDRNDKDDKRLPLLEALRDDLGWPENKEVDILAITHGDDDHVNGICDCFYLESNADCQTDDHIRIKELWVPAALLVEVGSKDHTLKIRQEARRRFKDGKGVRVFSRPDALRQWCRDNDIDFDSRKHLITDAGGTAPKWSLDEQGIEFFVHSPFAHRHDDGLEDRNGNCLVMQVVVRSGGRDTRVLMTADSIAENWVRIVEITKEHNNEDRLKWDILRIPHHCSYLSMADEKGTTETVPTDEFKWMLDQGAFRGVIVSSSDPIPSDYSLPQPPHPQTYKVYKRKSEELSGRIFVTMEHNSKSSPERLRIDISGAGVVPPAKRSTSATAATVAAAAPRNGNSLGG